MAITQSAKSLGYDVVDDVVTTNKTVFVRCDFNVPIKDGVITDDSRIKASLDTINYLIKTGARVVIGTHLGRPSGQYDSKLSTEIIARYLDRKLRCNVYFSDKCVGEEAQRMIFRASYGEVVVLENLRFHKEEEECDMTFAAKLAEGMNLYVNDAFSCSHRNHASIFGLPIFARPVAGFSLSRELAALTKVVNNRQGKTVSIIGGSKVSTKIDILRNLVKTSSALVIGGGMANTFLYAHGFNIGKSLCEPSLSDTVREIYDNAKESGCTIVVPHEVVVTKEIKDNAAFEIKDIKNIANDDLIVDVAPQFIAELKPELELADNILWNGPLGVFEVLPFNKGTNAVANIIADVTVKNKILSVVGGGDSVAAIKQINRNSDFSFISTAGGAFLEFIEGRNLPGVEILKRLSSANLPY